MVLHSLHSSIGCDYEDLNFRAKELIITSINIGDTSLFIHLRSSQILAPLRLIGDSRWMKSQRLNPKLLQRTEENREYVGIASVTSGDTNTWKGIFEFVSITSY